MGITRVGAVITLAWDTGAEVRTLLGPVVAVSTALTRAADVVGWTFTLLHAVRHRTTAAYTGHVQPNVRQPATRNDMSHGNVAWQCRMVM